MSRINQLLQNYRRHVSLPLRTNTASAQRIWFAVYPPDDERRLQHRLQEFELATRESPNRLSWHLIDLHGRLAEWFAAEDPEDLKTWFAHPEDIELYARSQWKDRLANIIKSEISALPDAERTVVALAGLMELFDFLEVSEVLETLERAVPGYLLLFFPGEREGNVYRFLCARDGWDYLAVPIVADR
jgi:Domain of unknown function (DUF1788).